MARILVIEDCSGVREEIVDILRFEGHEVVEAADGQQGLARVEVAVPDLVLCDLMMPVLDGYGVLEQLRAHPTWSTVPFIFLTARADRKGVRGGMERGADDYVTKPFAAEELLAAVGAALTRRLRQQGEIEAHLDDLREHVATSLPHELRTPLNVIMGYAELLRDCAGTFDAESVPDVAQQILDAGTRLHRLTENFLLYAQLEVLARSGTPPPSITTGAPRLDEVAASVATDIAQRHGRGGDVVVALPACPVAMEPGSLRKVIDELVDNACKFSAPGQAVRVTATVEGSWVTLEVKDEGRGMSPEEVGAIAGYRQFDRGRWEQQGSGLGLAIVRRIITLWGGEHTIESQPGGGTVIRMRLPLAAATGPIDHVVDAVP